MANLIPYGYSFQSERLPVPTGVTALPAGQSQMVTTICTLESYEFLLGTVETWFAEWSHVILVDHGLSEKQGNAYIVLEWEEAYIDRLFLQILESEDSVIDYVVYIRDSEV